MGLKLNLITSLKFLKIKNLKNYSGLKLEKNGTKEAVDLFQTPPEVRRRTCKFNADGHLKHDPLEEKIEKHSPKQKLKNFHLQLEEENDPKFQQ